MDLLVLGRAALSSQDTLLSSGVMYYTVQAGLVLVLHVSRASIMGMAAQLLHTRGAHAGTLTQSVTCAFKKEKKKKNGANNHPSGLQNNIRGNAELKCIKTHNMCHPSKCISNHQQSYFPCFCWGASQWVCSAGAPSSWLPDWALIANWCIVKHGDTLCCGMGCVLVHSPSAPLCELFKCHHSV